MLCIVRARPTRPLQSLQRLQCLRQPLHTSHRHFSDVLLDRAVDEAAEELDVPTWWTKELATCMWIYVCYPTCIRTNHLSDRVPQQNFQWNRQIPLSQIGQQVTAQGFLGKEVALGHHLSFAPLKRQAGQIQLLARKQISPVAKIALKAIPENSAVSATGVLHWKNEDKVKGEPTEIPDEGMCFIDQLEIRLDSITCTGRFPTYLRDDLNKANDPTRRHLQIRFNDELAESLKFRSKVAAYARKELESAGFQEVETPILHKPTPEGAREFIVPTQVKGKVYALPQSPQQYKQILMATGTIEKYYQFAKCFRDEGHRADRQPEFTQVSLSAIYLEIMLIN
jgi:aspartyl-tRNA synthetase